MLLGLKDLRCMYICNGLNKKHKNKSSCIFKTVFSIGSFQNFHGRRCAAISVWLKTICIEEFKDFDEGMFKKIAEIITWTEFENVCWITMMMMHNVVLNYNVAQWCTCWITMISNVVHNANNEIIYFLLL